tara:strand:+ start:95 stop:355 length:261 start_codon:yes stop_codon:yes gene_type:complete
MKYPRILGWSVVITMWVIMGVSLKCMKSSSIHHTDKCSDCQEVFNSAEDMIEWIIEDEASGNVGREQADTYIDNLEGIIINLGVTR